jgi:hypothetical protein
MMDDMLVMIRKLDNIAMLDYLMPVRHETWGTAMHGLATGLALFLALAIITIGTQYIWRPMAATRSFGLPLPANGANVAWWLRLKGVRDIASGVAVLAFMAWGTPLAIGILLLAEALIPIGDMLLILAAKGSTKAALGMHGPTAVLMVLTAIFMMIGGR